MKHQVKLVIRLDCDKDDIQQAVRRMLFNYLGNGMPPQTYKTKDGYVKFKYMGAME